MTLVTDVGVHEVWFPHLVPPTNVGTALIFWAQLHHVVRVLGKLLQTAHIRVKHGAAETVHSNAACWGCASLSG